MKYISHISKDGTKEPVIEHLRKVSKRAGEYASSFGLKTEAEHAGIMHDVGKLTKRFQEVIGNGTVRRCLVDHAMTSAIVYFNNSCSESAFAKRAIAGVIAAHHSELILDKSHYHEISDYNDPCETISHQETNKTISVSSKEEYDGIVKYCKENGLLPDALPKNPRFPFKEMDKESKELFTRMLCSCVVDADYTCTDEFMNGLTYSHD